MEDMPYDFGMRIQNARKANKLSQKELADKIDVTKDTISHYENNTQTPSLQRVAKIARVLNTSIDYLMGMENEPVIKLYGLSERQIVWLHETIDLILDKNNR